MGRVIALDALRTVREELRKQKKKVVFTNGCFDLIHRGHIEYLSRSKALGNVLIVGVNSDSSVKRIKGPKRPIVGEDDRAVIVAALSPVDYVCLFDQDTPFELISAIVPDILVKGADWKLEDIVGKDVVERAGGTVETIEFLPNRSSSAIIKLIAERFSPDRGAG